MKREYEWQIGLRDTCAGKRATGNGFVSFIAAVSMAGIAPGVAALIILLSVMNGFRSEGRDRMLSVLAHIEIFSPTGTMPDWMRTADESLRNPSVKRGAVRRGPGAAHARRQGDGRGTRLRARHSVRDAFRLLAQREGSSRRRRCGMSDGEGCGLSAFHYTQVGVSGL